MADHWIENHKRDSWRRQAKASGYRARSAFKLKQIQERFTLLREGDVVLDSTMGSGSTGVASKELNRKFIGIEKDQDIYNMAQNRINGN